MPQTPLFSPATGLSISQSISRDVSKKRKCKVKEKGRCDHMKVASTVSVWGSKEEEVYLWVKEFLHSIVLSSWAEAFS